MIHIYDPIYASTTGGGALSNPVTVASWFISGGGGTGREKKRGKRRAEVCSPSGKRSGKLLLFLLFNSRCVREWRKKERMEEGDGWIRIRDFFFFFFLIREITNRGSRRKIDKYIGKFCKYRSSNVVA